MPFEFNLGYIVQGARAALAKVVEYVVLTCWLLGAFALIAVPLSLLFSAIVFLRYGVWARTMLDTLQVACFLMNCSVQHKSVSVQTDWIGFNIVIKGAWEIYSLWIVLSATAVVMFALGFLALWLTNQVRSHAR